MKKIFLQSFSVCFAIFILATFAAADPTKDKNESQQIAEKFVSLSLSHNFEEAAKLIEPENNIQLITQTAESLRKANSEVRQGWQRYYEERFGSASLESRVLHPQTLVSSKRGNDQKFNVLVFFTEDHEVLILGKQKPWHFYWHVEMMFAITNSKITDFKVVSPSENLMILKPEDCILPAVCPQ